MDDGDFEARVEQARAALAELQAPSMVVARAGEAAFNAWYGPWERGMASDPLLVYFNVLRRMVVHFDRRGAIGVVMSAYGEGAPPVGSISIDGVEVPESHLGEPITERSVSNLCRMYADYLGRMFDDFAPIAFGVQDRRIEGARSE